MKRFGGFPALFAATLVLGGAALVALPVAPAQAASKQEEKTPLQLAMRQVMKLVRALGSSTEEPAFYGEAADQAAELQSVLLKAKREVPSRAEGMDEEARAEFVTAFRRHMIQMLHATLDLEDKLLSDASPDEVADALDRLSELKKVGHDRFK